MAATLPERIALARPGFLPPGPETRYLLTPRAGGLSAAAILSAAILLGLLGQENRRARPAPVGP